MSMTSSHELCEAITDPVPGERWYDQTHGEIGYAIHSSRLPILYSGISAPLLGLERYRDQKMRPAATRKLIDGAGPLIRPRASAFDR